MEHNNLDSRIFEINDISVKQEIEFVYIVIENGEANSNAYKTYESAVKVVNDKYKEELDRQIEEIPDYKDHIIELVNPIENPSGKTFLYIEKGTYIDIYKLPIAKIQKK